MPQGQDFTVHFQRFERLQDIPEVFEWYNSPWIQTVFQHNFPTLASSTSTFSAVHWIGHHQNTPMAHFMVQPGTVAYLTGIMGKKGYRNTHWALQVIHQFIPALLEHHPNTRLFEAAMIGRNDRGMQMGQLLGLKPVVIRREAIWARQQHVDLLHYAWTRQQAAEIGNRAARLLQLIPPVQDALAHE